MHAARHEIVARALPACERVRIGVSISTKPSASRAARAADGQLVPQANRLLKARATEVHVAMLQPQLLVRFRFVVHRERDVDRGVVDHDLVARTSTLPVWCFGFGASRIATVPLTPTTSSACSFSAIA